MPERIGETNMWKLLDGEYFETLDGKKVQGPLMVRVYDFEKGDLLMVQGAEEKYEVPGKTIEDFERVVKREG